MMSFLWWDELIEHMAKGAAVMSVCFCEFSQRLFVKYICSPEMFLRTSFCPVWIAETMQAVVAAECLDA
jgi:hypothetical protein